MTGTDPMRMVLGLMPGASKDEVRRVYRRLVAEHHPDRLIAKGVPERTARRCHGRRMAAVHQPCPCTPDIKPRALALRRERMTESQASTLSKARPAS